MTGKCIPVSTVTSAEAPTLLKRGSDTLISSQVPELLGRGIVLCSELARGGQGSVWRALRENQSQAAVKIVKKNISRDGVVDTRQERNMMREISVLKLINHRSILSFIDFCESETCWFLVTELIDGLDMFEFLSRESLTEREILFVAGRVLHALAHLHSKGISHRDVKLENVMISRKLEGAGSVLQVKLIDFGLAHWEEFDGKGVKTFPGTAQYKSPEMLVHKQGVDARPSDVWAVGVLLFATLTNTFPLTTQQLRERKLPDDISFDKWAWSQVRPTTAVLVHSCLQCDMAHRPSAALAYRFTAMMARGEECCKTRASDKTRAPSVSAA